MQEIEGTERFLFGAYDNGLKNRAVLVFSMPRPNSLCTEDIEIIEAKISSVCPKTGKSAFIVLINPKNSPFSDVKIEIPRFIFNDKYPGLSPNICKERTPIHTFNADPSAPPRSALLPEIKTNSFNIHGKKQTHFRPPVNGNNRKDCHGKQKSNAQQRRWFAQKGK